MRKAQVNTKAQQTCRGEGAIFGSVGVTECLGEGRTMEWMDWSLRREAESLAPLFDWPVLFNQLDMNVIVWNCRGALKSNFQRHVRELVRTHNPTILVVMETWVGGGRAKEIIDCLPFDGDILAETIGYAGGVWLLWNSNRVEVEQLASIIQEIHAKVKVLPSNLSWILSAVYASPRIVERQVLWENLTKVAKLHSKPWIIAGNFNEPLTEVDKFGGRLVRINKSLLFKDFLDKSNMVNMGFSGLRYTWTNKREISSLIQERIDRFL